MDRGNRESEGERAVTPRLVIVVSGKRKTGKDYLGSRLVDAIGESSALVHLSSPIKSHWARTHGLDLQALLGDGHYKERYRAEMVAWSEEVRRRDPGYFCRLATDSDACRERPIWVVSDARRPSDVSWFQHFFPGRVKTVRMHASDELRRHRGWTFVAGIDDAETECALDSFPDWDLIVENNETGGLEKGIETIFTWVQHFLSDS
ncbi:unnamed protein product [Darwinula stevensoni]|uniref:Phosphomevalonate kinase n=1 Tax=Darwinula stevensoni TaxID=69355 RepID=A0A7R8XFP3_9CRUS|nr:unnamed protein product [Darwinula stevensoni]CAG0889014.1 unnamed protein product [Darwinula stevensoni]